MRFVNEVYHVNFETKQVESITTTIYYPNDNGDLTEIYSERVAVKTEEVQSA
jgi:hypothetical protein